MTNLAHEAGWYSDPQDPRMQRWWDGATWTQHVQPATGAAGGAQHAMAGGFANHQGGFQAPAKTSGLAIASLVTAILSLGLVPLILGIFALRSIGKAPASAPRTGSWMAIVGIVLGSVQVLILIPILLAVAIPTFLAQKGTASSAQAKANVRQVINATESCATQNADGGYAGCGPEALPRFEPSLGPVLEKGCTVPGGVCFEFIDRDLGYSARALADLGNGKRVMFTETHSGTGVVSKTCAPTVPGVCATGTW